MKQLRIPAVYMRGGTSKGVFFLADDLPSDPVDRDRILMRVTGSPDRYGKHIDGMGGATSSTSKVVVLSKSKRADCDVDYLFGAVAIEAPAIDWSGNCGNLTAAVGPFAIYGGLVAAPADGIARVRIWQANISRKIVAHVPMSAGEVQEAGDFELDGVAFPAAEIRLEFLDPAAEDGAPAAQDAAVIAGGAARRLRGLFPSGNPLDRLELPGSGSVEATLIDAGNPTVFVDAASLGLVGTELQEAVNGRSSVLELAEHLRARGAVAMGLVATPEEATERRPHTPKLAFVAKPTGYIASDGKRIAAESVDLLARIFSMGRLHHAMTGTGSVAIAAAAAIPGTVVSRVAPMGASGEIRFGHPSGTARVGVDAVSEGGRWVVRKVTLSRSARRLMEGWVRVPSL